VKPVLSIGFIHVNFNWFSKHKHMTQSAFLRAFQFFVDNAFIHLLFRSFR